MAKKPQTREELLAQLEALDNSTEIATLKNENERLTLELAAMTAARKESDREATRLEEKLDIIRKALAGTERLSRRHVATDPATDPSRISARLSSASVQVGIAKGTHDPRTGLEFTPDTKPIRDLSAGTAKVTSTELERIFPELAGPSVVLTEAETEEAFSALEIAQA